MSWGALRAHCMLDASAPTLRTSPAKLSQGTYLPAPTLPITVICTTLQKPATSRLHRFYVPQPLGLVPPSAAADPLLEALLPPLPLHSPAPSAALPGSPAAPNGPFTPASVVLEGEEARHAARALRLAAGDAVELCDGTGHVVAGTVTGTDKQRVWVSARSGYRTIMPQRPT